MTLITVINLQGQYIYQDCSNCNQFTGNFYSDSTFTITVTTNLFTGSCNSNYIYHYCNNCNLFTGSCYSNSTFTITVTTVINLQGAVPEEGSGAGKPW